MSFILSRLLFILQTNKDCLQQFETTMATPTIFRRGDDLLNGLYFVHYLNTFSICLFYFLPYTFNDKIHLFDINNDYAYSQVSKRKRI